VQLKKHGEYMHILKNKPAITHRVANFITLKFREADTGSPDTDNLDIKRYKVKKTSNQSSINYKLPLKT
jgi:hypothetical protein